jgi:hypothetical protein
MMSKFCTNCGAKLDDDAKFCSKCGEPQDVQQPAQSSAQQPAQQGTVSNSKNFAGAMNVAADVEEVKPQTVENDLGETPFVMDTPMSESAFDQSNSRKMGDVLIYALGVLVLFFIVSGCYDSLVKPNKTLAYIPQKQVSTQASKQQYNKAGGVNTSNQGNNSQFANSKVDVRASVAAMQNFEDRLADFAGRINGKQEDSSALIAVGNVLKDDITMERNKLRNAGNDTTAQQIDQLLRIQWKRADCMVRGLNGIAGAYAEGSGYYDEFQTKFSNFKQSRGI